MREDGSIVLGGTAHDITDLRLAQQQLQQSEERLRLVLDNVGDAILQVDQVGTLLWASPSLRTVLGREPEAVIGQRPQLVCPEDRAETVTVVLTAVRERAKEVHHRSRTARGDGRVILVDNTERLLWNEEGRFTGVICAIRDVTDQVEAQEALATSQEHFRLLAEQGTLVARISGFQDVDAQVRAEQAVARSERRFRLARESAPTGMAVVYLDRRFVAANPALGHMLGRDEAWLQDHGVSAVLVPEDDVIDPRMRAEVMSGRVESSSHHHRMITVDGEHVWAEHSVCLLRDEDGTPLWYVSQFLDVTSAHRAQERLGFLAGPGALTSLANRHQLLTRLSRLLPTRPGLAANWRCCSWTWTISSPSTIPTGMPPATRCWWNSPDASPPTCERTMWPRGPMATSS